MGTEKKGWLARFFGIHVSKVEKAPEHHDAPKKKIFKVEKVKREAHHPKSKIFHVQKNKPQPMFHKPEPRSEYKPEHLPADIAKEAAELEKVITQSESGAPVKKHAPTVVAVKAPDLKMENIVVEKPKRQPGKLTKHDRFVAALSEDIFNVPKAKSSKKPKPKSTKKKKR